MPPSRTRSASAKEAIRPPIPPVLAVALAFWGTAALALWLERALDSRVCFGIALCALLASIACLIILVKRFPRGICIAMGLCLGCVIASAYAALLLAQTQDVAHDSAGASFVIVRCDDDAKKGSYSPTCAATIVNGAHAGTRVRLRFDDARTPEAESAAFGDEGLPLSGTLIEAQVRFASVSDSARDYYWREGFAGTAVVKDWQVRSKPAVQGFARQLRAAAISHISACKAPAPIADLVDTNGEAHETFENARMVLSALVCGYRAELGDSTIYESYKQAGLAHLIAVSGAHLSIVVALAGSMLEALRCPRRGSRVLQLAFIVLYLVIAGIPTSALRAAIMAICSMLASYPKRRPAALNAMGVCMLAMIGLSPRNALSVSFALSAGSTLGIIVFAPLFASWLEAIPVRIPRFVRESLALTLAASICTLPLSAALFSQLPLISPVSNVLVGPLFAIVCPTAVFLVLLACAVPILRNLCLAGAIALSALLDQATVLLASAPFACIPFDCEVVLALALSGAACIALWWIWPPARALRRAALPLLMLLSAAALAFCAIAVPARFDDRIIALDVGQGDAIVLRSRGCTCLIDTGNEDELLKQALARTGTLRVDTLIISHADDDHCGSLEQLASVARIGKVLVAADMTHCEDASCAALMERLDKVAADAPIVAVHPGDEFACGRFRLQVVWPDSFADEGGNADSLCILAAYDGDGDGSTDLTAFFGGDAESEQMNTMISQKRIAHVDILKVGHHGSKAALDERCAQALSPRIALVSVGAGNDYGHPNPATIALLERCGAKVFRTDEQGDLSCVLGSDGIRVVTQR